VEKHLTTESAENTETIIEAKQKLRLAVLVSGSGTNLQALMDRATAGQLAAEIVVVASDRANAQGLVRARTAGVPTHVVDYRAHRRRQLGIGGGGASHSGDTAVDLEDLDRRQRILTLGDPAKRRQLLAALVSAEQELIGALDAYRPDIVCLAGYMRLLSPYFLSHYNQPGRFRVLNIHPALLPAFPGQHGYDDTFAYGCRWGGVTVHFVDEGEDTGPVIAQAVYPIWPEDDIDAIRQRGLRLEYEIYAQCINWLAAGQLQLRQVPGNRFMVRINDPAYRHIVQDWLELALAGTA
jgi:phosphoribosylglycinamide formyltransferase-1